MSEAEAKEASLPAEAAAEAEAEAADAAKASIAPIDSRPTTRGTTEPEVPGSKWLSIKKPPQKPLLSAAQLKSFAAELNATLLAEVEALPGQFNMVHDERFDVMNRTGDYNVTKDAQMSTALAIVAREDARRAADKGPSVSKERFSSKYWNHWNRDYVLLEDLSRTELEAQRERERVLGARKPPPLKNPKLKKVTPLERSHMTGNTFGLPKETRPPTFDLHQQGNRNDALELYRHSLGAEPPKALYQSALLNSHANVDPDACGRRSLKGGVINTGPARPRAAQLLTAGCDVPPVDKPRGSPKMTGFGGSGRSSSLGAQAAAPGGGVVEEYKVPRNAVGFSRAERGAVGGPPEQGNGVPGAGTYDVPRIFEGKADPKPRDLSHALLLLQNTKDYGDMDQVELAKAVGFGFGCKRQEHVLYGMCLDGQCGRRSEVEHSMLKTKQFRRMGAPSGAALNQLLYCQDATPRLPRAASGALGLAASSSSSSSSGGGGGGGGKSGGGGGGGSGSISIGSGGSGVEGRSSEQEALLRADRERTRLLRQTERSRRRWQEERRLWTETLVPPPAEELPPLHMAAHRGDCEAIARMRRLGGDVNERQGEERDTPLIVAARRGHLEAVRALLDTFDGVIDVDARNSQGDTALHVAARAARAEVVRVLCEADADCSLRNHEGKLPTEETNKHAVKSILSIQSDYQSLHGELRKLQRRRQKLEASAASGREADPPRADSHALRTASRGSSRGESRGSSRGSERSRILDLDAETRYDEERESIKINRSMFAVSATPSTLADPKMNSYIVGYYPPEPVAKKKTFLALETK